MQVLEAGRDLDVEVAVTVMGFQRRTTEANDQQFVVVPHGWTDFSTFHWWGRNLYEQVPNYSSEIAAAWQLVDRLIDQGWMWQIDMRTVEQDWHVLIDNPDGRICSGAASTVTLAICRAALSAFESPNPDAARVRSSC